MITKQDKVGEVPKIVALVKDAMALFPDMGPAFIINAALGAWVAKDNKIEAVVITMKRRKKCPSR